MYESSLRWTMIAERIDSYRLLAQGFRSVRLEHPEKVLHDLRESFPGAEVQLLRADRIAGKEHLSFSAKNAVDSFGGKDRRAKRLAMEFLLFASGQHQIIEAIKLLGVTPSTSEVVVTGLFDSEPDLHLVAVTTAQLLGGKPDDSVVDIYNSRKATSLKKAYKITERELDSARIPGETEEMILKRLILERSAMLSLEN